MHLEILATFLFFVLLEPCSNLGLPLGAIAGDLNKDNGFIELKTWPDMCEQRKVQDNSNKTSKLFSFVTRDVKFANAGAIYFPNVLWKQSAG